MIADSISIEELVVLVKAQMASEVPKKALTDKESNKVLGI